VPSFAASLGNVSTYAALGAMLRIGNELEADFGPPRVRPVSAGSVFFAPVHRWGWYAFAGVEGRAVLRDISLAAIPGATAGARTAAPGSAMRASGPQCSGAARA